MFEFLAEVAERYATSWIDKGLVPDFLLRFAIRKLLNVRKALLAKKAGTTQVARTEYKHSYIASLDEQDIATHVELANKQHYEVSTEFLQSCLGKRMKYSSCLYEGIEDKNTTNVTLDEAEAAMLELYCARAKVEDGMDILDLGCGWGSLCLYLAEKYPRARIHALSNSSTQKTHIDSKGFTNLTVHTGDVRVFDFSSEVRFDRILCIEMLEHMKNYRLLFAKISSWLKPNVSACGPHGALFFSHIFCHKDTPYHFEEGDGWMSQMFFSGGTMASFDLFTYFQHDMTLERTWWINGRNYARTLEDWLRLQDKNNKNNLSIIALQKDAIAKGMREEDGRVNFHRFRVFFIACAELFASDKGETWGVGHYLFHKRD